MENGRMTNNDDLSNEEVGVRVDNEHVDMGLLGSEKETDNERDEKQSRRIEDAILKREVSNVNIDRLESIENCQSYLLDFSSSKSAVVPSWLSALKNIIISTEYMVLDDRYKAINEQRLKKGRADLRADSAVYIKTKSGVVLAGYADSLQLYKFLRDLIVASFGDTVKIYIGKGEKAKFSEWKGSDITGIRLKL